MNKKAQMEHVFTIIATILIAGAIILIGSKLIFQTAETKCDTDFIRFKDDIGLAISNNNNYGSVTSQSFRIPCKSEILCLVDTDYMGEDISENMPSELDSQSSFIISNSVKDGVEENIFLVSREETKPVGFSNNLLLEGDQGILCISGNGGEFSMIMNGQGRKTLITSKNNIVETST